jgi:hypothetical protein
VIATPYFESKSLRDVGAALGISEEAAQKRVSRALERLRDFFARRGSGVSVGAVATYLTSQATEAAPANLTAAISTGQVGAVAAQLAKGTIMTSTQKAIVAVVVALALVGTVAGGIVSIRALMAPAVTSQVTTAPATPSAAATGKWTAGFPDGAKVELVAIAEFFGREAAPPRWWAPDGAAMANPGFDVRDNADLGDMRNTRKVQLLFRFSGISDPDRLPRVFVNEAGMQVANWQGDWQQHSDLRQVIAAVPNDNTLASVRIGLPKPQFNETVLLDLNGGAPPADLPVTVGAITSNADGGCGVEVLRLPLDARDLRFERRIVVVSKDGTRFQPTTSIALPQGLGQRIRYKCAKDQIDRIILATRSVEWMVMKNVSTVPTSGKPTEVQVGPLTDP